MFYSSQGQCFLIAIEGPDKVGKATQAELLEDKLQRRGIKAMTVEVPWKDDVTYDLIYSMLKSGEAKEHPIVFQTLQATNRRILQETYLPNLTTHFDVVILDRWTPSTWAYGAASGIPTRVNEVILQGLVEPDFTIILDGVPFGHEREDTYEADNVFQQEVRRQYREYQMRFPEQTIIEEAAQHRLVLADKIAVKVRQVVLGSSKNHGGEATQSRA